MDKPTVLTLEGKRKLDEELEQLKTVKRRDIADKIKTALSFGDLSENSEYDEAKNEQAMVEARISQLESMLKNVELLDKNKITNDIVAIGTHIAVLDIAEKDVMYFFIVSSTEADGKQFLSDESPVGKALMGKRVGATVSVETPGGVMSLKLLRINRDEKDD